MIEVAGDNAIKVGELSSSAAGTMAQLAQVHQDAFSAIDQAGWTAAALTDACAANGAYAVFASSEGRAIGFALYRQVLDEAELITLAVAPGHQGKSIARQLLQHAAGVLKARDVTKVFLEVRADNSPAIKLYENAGFTAVSVRKNYYKLSDNRRVDAVNYSKALH